MRHIFSYIADQIEELIRDRKLRWLIAIPSGIATALAIFGLVNQLKELTNITLLCASIFLGLVVIVLAVSRRYMRRELAQRDKILRQYGDSIFSMQHLNEDFFTIAKWEEEQTVVKRGDTTIVRDIHLQAGSSPVPAVWTRASRGSGANLTPQIRDKIRVEARFINDDGTVGTALVSGFSWEDDKTILILIYFDQDLQPAETTSLRLTIRWPRYSADMLDGSVGKEYWRFWRRVDSFSTRVTYTKDFAPLGVRITTLPGSPEVLRSPNKTDGSTSLDFAIPAVEPRKEYGYRVEVIRQQFE